MEQVSLITMKIQNFKMYLQIPICSLISVSHIDMRFINSIKNIISVQRLISIQKLFYLYIKTSHIFKYKIWLVLINIIFHKNFIPLFVDINYIKIIVNLNFTVLPIT